MRLHVIVDVLNMQVSVSGRYYDMGQNPKTWARANKPWTSLM